MPDGWERSERDTGVFYATKGDRNLLQIFVITEGDLTPYEAVRQSSKNLGSQQPGYEEVSLDRGAAPEGASPAVGEDTARLVYAYDSEKLGTRKQGVEYAFTAADGKKYALVAAGPLDDWAMTRESAEIGPGPLGDRGLPGLRGSTGTEGQMAAGPPSRPAATCPALSAVLSGPLSRAAPAGSAPAPSGSSRRSGSTS